MEKLLNLLNFDDAFQNLVRGEINIPYNNGEYNNLDNYWYPHPPALIPLFVGHGASYYGVLNHFFFKRSRTFVEYVLENGYFSEKQRNEKQFITKLILEQIMLKEELTAETQNFAQNCNYTNSKDVLAFAENYGDDPEQFDKLVFFKDDLPLYYCDNLEQYQGDFPSSCEIFNPKQITNSCSFEIAAKSFLKGLVNLPLWLETGADQQKLFEGYLANDDLKSAWLTLNSTGWFLIDVAKGLEKLKLKTQDRLFHLVADNWIEGWRRSTFLEGNY
ncbi:hypothetical protein [Mucilaginibacter sp. KACC 22063]|uniref:hypothetical protein n=1 Tax=Mucilaginibacter sp. KACC 22063 TaxID=3025666 RepID=UPI00236679BE|nr:hypothetical protein [Mucilaginibacter sp. KACC 22063]WDF54382.1 hypothetical protein PQ461_15675 [Mucilaginibacter sp. KACC 22063]